MPALVFDPSTPDVDAGNRSTLSLSDTGKVQVSVGGAAPTSVIAGATVHVASPLTGDGSIGSPITAPLATGIVNGLMPHNTMALLGKVGPLLTDANTIIDPETDKASVYVLPANTLTQARAFTFDEAGALFNGIVTWVVVHPQSFNAEIASVANGTLFSVPAGPNTFVIELYKGGAGYILASGFYGNN